MPRFTLHINGKKHRIIADADTPLLWILRDELGYTGTKFGCGRGFCGACTIHLDGEAIRSCMTAVEYVEDRRITTIEGLSENNSHSVQKAWLAEEVPQCGYCQSGQIMAAVDFTPCISTISPEVTPKSSFNRLSRVTMFLPTWLGSGSWTRREIPLFFSIKSSIEMVLSKKY